MMDKFPVMMMNMMMMRMMHSMMPYGMMMGMGMGCGSTCHPMSVCNCHPTPMCGMGSGMMGMMGCLNHLPMPCPSCMMGARFHLNGMHLGMHGVMGMGGMNPMMMNGMHGM